MFREFGVRVSDGVNSTFTFFGEGTVTTAASTVMKHRFRRDMAALLTRNPDLLIFRSDAEL
jgi:hypothetical protein